MYEGMAMIHESMQEKHQAISLLQLAVQAQEMVFFLIFSPKHISRFNFVCCLLALI